MDKKPEGADIRETLEFPKFSLIMKTKFENNAFDNIDENTKTFESKSPRSSMNHGNVSVIIDSSYTPKHSQVLVLNQHVKRNNSNSNEKTMEEIND